MGRAAVTLGLAVLLFGGPGFPGLSQAQNPPPPREASDQPPPALQPVERPDEELVVLDMHLPPYILARGMFCYMHRGGVLAPLSQMMAAFDFPITVDPVTGQADGWFIRENRVFSLDLRRRQVVIAGEVRKYDPSKVELHSDDIYVDTSLLSKWFPVDIEFDLSRLLLQVTSREPLPLEERLEREKRRARLGPRGGARPDYPRVETPYRLLDWPFIDTTYNVDYRNETDQVEGRFNSLVSGDLLYMNSNLFLAGTHEDSLTDIRLDLGRKDPEGGLFGPLRVQEFSLGDIFTPQIPLISDSRAGRGIEMSSFPLERPSEFDRTTLRGELPIGWEVELYRNEILLDSQVEPNADGRYEFIDVPLLFGLNVLRLIFYGPQGQRREEVVRVFAGEDLVPPGKQYFRIAVNQQNKDLIQIAGQETQAEETDGEERYFMEYERGIARQVSLAGTFASLPLEEAGRRNFFTLGVRASVLGTFSRLDVSRDDAGNTGILAAFQTKLLGLNLFAEHGHFLGFVSERVEEETDPLDTRTDVRIDTVIPAWILPRIPFTLRGLIERHDSGRTDADISNRLSIFTHGISASNNLSLVLGRGGGTPPSTQFTGSFLLSSRIQRLSLRGTLDYELKPESELTAVSATGDYDFTRDLTARVTFSRQLTGERINTYSAGINKRFRAFALGVDSSYSDDGNFTAGLNLTFSLGREPRRPGVIMTSDRMATSGAASARVFLDRNQNNTFDPEEDEPLEGVGFRPAPKEVQTDEKGIAFIPGLSSHRPTSLTVEQKTLADPFWKVNQEGWQMVPRPGRSVLLDFPVTPTGEIDGTVFLKVGDREKEVSNAAIQLLDAEGTVIDEVKTAYDGFYLFTEVPPGRYIVRVSPDQVERLNLATPPEERVEIEGTGNIVNGIDFVVERARKTESEKTPPGE